MSSMNNENLPRYIDSIDVKIIGLFFELLFDRQTRKGWEREEVTLMKEEDGITTAMFPNLSIEYCPEEKYLEIIEDTGEMTRVDNVNNKTAFDALVKYSSRETYIPTVYGSGLSGQYTFKYFHTLDLDRLEYCLRKYGRLITLSRYHQSEGVAFQVLLEKEETHVNIYGELYERLVGTEITRVGKGYCDTFSSEIISLQEFLDRRLYYGDIEKTAVKEMVRKRKEKGIEGWESVGVYKTYSKDISQPLRFFSLPHLSFSDKYDEY